MPLFQSNFLLVGHPVIGLHKSCPLWVADTRTALCCRLRCHAAASPESCQWSWVQWCGDMWGWQIVSPAFMVPLFSFVRALQQNLFTAERGERGKKQKTVFLTNCWLKTLLCSLLLPGEVHPPFCQPFGCRFCPAFSKRSIETIWNQAWPGAKCRLWTFWVWNFGLWPRLAAL